MSTQTTPQRQGNTLIFRLLPDYHPPGWFTTRNNGINRLSQSSDAEAAYTRGSAMPAMARSKEPYPLDKLAEIDTDQLLSVVTYPPEWYLNNVLSATEEAAGWARRMWGCEADVKESLTTAMGSMNIADVEATQSWPPTSLESLPHEIFAQICERLSIASLWSLKCSSRRFSALVSSLRDVQFALDHASGMVAILLRMGAAEFWTFSGLKRLMTGKKAHLCEGCLNPGPFVLLLNPLSRKCWACLTQGIIFSDLRLEITQTREAGAGGLKWIKVVQREEEQEDQAKETRPQYRSRKISIKGGPDDPFLRFPLPLEFEAAYTTKGKRRKTSKGEVTIHLPPTFTGETLYKVASATPLYRRPYGITEDEFRAFALFRYVAVWLPHVSPKPDQPQGHPGQSSHICWGCLLASRVTEYPDDPELAGSSAAWMELRIGMGQYRKLVYSRDEYLQHFRWCRLAQERWEAAVRNRDLRTGELVVPEEYETETLENTESVGW